VIKSAYIAAFQARFLLMLQYRAAALAGFGTQVWFGMVRVAILAAFYRASAIDQPINLGQAIDYVWLGQAFLALLPWAGDPDVAAGVRTGNIGYDRLRPIDTYFYWYARAAGWMIARALPRAALMFAFAGVAAPLVGLGAWGLKPPASIEAFALFAISMTLVVLLSSAITNLISAGVVAAMTDRGPVLLASAVVTFFSGNIVPLPLFPDELRIAMLVQPFAGLVDIPSRIYFGALTGEMALVGLGLQVFWTLVLVAFGRWALEAAMQRLQAQGG
jgi:ABC-2 type transport system permease protein